MFRTASDFSDALAEKAVQLVFGHLIDCYRDGSNLVAREKCTTLHVLPVWPLLTHHLG